MKIIELGRLKSDRDWRGKCDYCKSVIEAKERELILHHDQREGEWGDANCIVCGNRMIFYPKTGD